MHTLRIDALCYNRPIEATSCARLASKFPNLHTLELLLSDTCKSDKDLRKRNRDGMFYLQAKFLFFTTDNVHFHDLLMVYLEFAAHLHLLPPSIRTFNFNFVHGPPRNHNFSPDDITDQGVDALSSQLHKFSQQLETLIIYGLTFGNELFWPPESNDNRPSWPDLKTIDMGYAPSTPSGKWLFVDRSDRDEDDRYESTDSDLYDQWPEYVRTELEDRVDNPFREANVPGLFNELYMAVGQAALYMPKLEDLRMRTESGTTRHRFGYSTEPLEGHICATWADCLGFQPEERVLNLWKQVASEHTGQDITVKLCDD